MPGRCPTNRASLFPAGIIRNPGTEYTPSRRLSRPLKYPIHGGRHTVRQRCFYTRVDVDKVDWAWTCRGDDAKIVALRKQGIERTESICPWGFEVTVPVGTSRNLSGFASYRALSVDSVLATLRAYFSAIFLIVLPPRIVNGTQRVFSMGTLEKPTPLRFLRRNQ